MDVMPAMRSIWNGAITFGLISIPVRLFTAVEEKSLKFHQLHAADNGRIRYKRVCSVDEEEVPYEEIVKGYEYERDRYVVFTDEELERLPVDSLRTIGLDPTANCLRSKEKSSTGACAAPGRRIQSACQLSSRIPTPKYAGSENGPTRLVRSQVRTFHV